MEYRRGYIYYRTSSTRTGRKLPYGLYELRPFSSELAGALRQRGGCVRALCESLCESKNMTCASPSDTLCSQLHTPHFISSHLISSNMSSQFSSLFASHPNTLISSKLFVTRLSSSVRHKALTAGEFNPLGLTFFQFFHPPTDSFEVIVHIDTQRPLQLCYTFAVCCTCAAFCLATLLSLIFTTVAKICLAVPVLTWCAVLLLMLRACSTEAQQGVGA